LVNQDYPHKELSFVTRSGITTKFDESARITESNFYRSASNNNQKSQPMSINEGPLHKNEKQATKAIKIE
jgi:hypothetical protein